MADSTGLMHTRVFVLAADADKARDDAGRRVFSREEIAERAVADAHTGARRILVHPSATEQCKALRTFFSRHKPEPGFHDACGGRYSWAMESKARAHFSRWPCEHDVGTDKATGPLSEAHENAIDHLCQLLTHEKLKVIQTCTCATHKRRPELMKHVPFWAWHWGCENPYITRWWISKFHDTNSGFELVKGWKWHPDPSEKAFFVLDLAVLDARGKLLWAIEVQHTHANSAKKREAFEAHNVTHLQLEAKEVLSVCTGRDWMRNPRYPPLHHHPVSATEPWVCPECTTSKLADEKRAEAKRAKTERERVKRQRQAEAAAEKAVKEDAQRAFKRECRAKYFEDMGFMCMRYNANQRKRERKWLTTFNNPVNGRVLRGRPVSMPTKTDDGWYRLFLVNDSWTFLILTRDESLRIRWDLYEKERGWKLYVQVWDTLPVPDDAKYGAPPDCLLPAFMMYDDKDGAERPIGIKDFPPEETMEKYYERHGVELDEE